MFPQIHSLHLDDCEFYEVLGNELDYVLARSPTLRTLSLTMVFPETSFGLCSIQPYSTIERLEYSEFGSEIPEFVHRLSQLHLIVPASLKVIQIKFYESFSFVFGTELKGKWNMVDNALSRLSLERVELTFWDEVDRNATDSTLRLMMPSSYDRVVLRRHTSLHSSAYIS
ncbi:hypothetical protein NLI96_g8727 [Meripilus lineatus]|uniref:Uncharacterized protein n=1 Tax=Meripilus lineatus TaxID=2056292 RepID=A0AAD5YFY3_9APHY|nr:hypothetical protein NLI96_g8727 [Physisporinus lineatus]